MRPNHIMQRNCRLFSYTSVRSRLKATLRLAKDLNGKNTYARIIIDTL